MSKEVLSRHPRLLLLGGLSRCRLAEPRESHSVSYPLYGKAQSQKQPGPETKTAGGAASTSTAVIRPARWIARSAAGVGLPPTIRKFVRMLWRRRAHGTTAVCRASAYLRKGRSRVSGSASDLQRTPDCGGPCSLLWKRAGRSSDSKSVAAGVRQGPGLSTRRHGAGDAVPRGATSRKGARGRSMRWSGAPRKTSMPSTCRASCAWQPETGVAGGLPPELSRAQSEVSRGPSRNLARLDIGEGKLDAARLALTEMLKTNPTNGVLMIELAQLEEQAGHYRRPPAGWRRRLTIRAAAGECRRLPEVGCWCASATSNESRQSRQGRRKPRTEGSAALYALARAELAAAATLVAPGKRLGVMGPVAGFDEGRQPGHRQTAVHGRRSGKCDVYTRQSPAGEPGLSARACAAYRSGRSLAAIMSRPSKTRKRSRSAFPARGLGAASAWRPCGCARPIQSAIASYRASLAKKGARYGACVCIKPPCVPEIPQL